MGGHAFDVNPLRLEVSLWLTIGTGVVLAAIEAGPRLLCFHQGRALMTMTKVALICAVPLAWDFRLPILLTAIVVASVGSHMPARYRYFSVVYRQVIHDGSGPGGKGEQEEETKTKI